MTQEERWMVRYEEVMAFIESNHRNPSKHRIEEHDMLNWLKANRKVMNAGKISPETIGKSVKDIYVKKDDYDESIYLVKHTDDTAKIMVELFDDIQNEVNKNTSFGVTDRFNELKDAGEIQVDKDNMIEQLKKVYNDLHDENFRKELEKRKMEIHQVFLQLKLEAVLNTNQYK